MRWILIVLPLFFIVGCGEPIVKKSDESESKTDATTAGKSLDESPKTEPEAPKKVMSDGKEPDIVKVQHVLIAFKGATRSQATRSRDEAQKLAMIILQKAKDGSDFDALMEEYSNDSGGGIYTMSNHNVSPPGGGYARSGMATVFGDVGFSLEVGEIGMGEYHPQTSPFGWHIIKRLE